MSTVLITGGSRGIGAAAARAFAREGYSVALTYKSSKAEAEALVAELAAQGHSAAAIYADVSREVDVQQLFKGVHSRFGDVHVLINNAGIAQQKQLQDVSLGEWEQLFAVNMRGVFLCSRQALPGMIAKKRGAIINISSIWGITGASCEVAYSATKAAVIGFSRALAKEVGPSGIRVNCVAPGVIDTDMNSALGAEALDALLSETPLGRLGTPQDIAQLLVFLAGPGGSFITGQVISPNGGLVC